MSQHLDERRRLAELGSPKRRGGCAQLFALIGPALVAGFFGCALAFASILGNEYGVDGEGARAQRAERMVACVISLVVLALGGIPLYVATYSAGDKARKWYRVAGVVIAVGLVASIAFLGMLVTGSAPTP